MDENAQVIVMGLLLVTLGVATAGWLVSGRRAGLALAALTVGGLGVLGALASATLGPVAADRAWSPPSSR